MNSNFPSQFINELLVDNNRITGENFSITHPGKTVLFAGCSFTAGDGLLPEENWAYKTYQKFLDDGIQLNGYRNIGVSGASITDVLDQVINYIIKYGNPDVIFIMLPEPFRDCKYTEESSLGLRTMVARTYKYLYHYCKANNIKLITITWFKIISNIQQQLNKKTIWSAKLKNIFLNSNKDPLVWNNQLENDQTNYISKVLGQYETYYDYAESDMINFIMNKDLDPNNKRYLIADDGTHPGTLFHDYWSNYMYERYKDDNIRN